MPIEFRCTGCQQQLRVPDTSAGKNAKCPKCGAVVVVPAALGATLPGLSPSPPTSPFGDAAQSAPSPSPFSSSPMGGASPFAPAGAGGASPNPYASPQSANYQPPISVPGGPIVNQQVSVEQIFNYAWQIWQLNLGLLVGVNVALFAIIYGFAFVQGFAQAALEQDSPEAAALVGGVGSLISNLIQMFLGIGQVQIALKLVRRQPANFSDLFGGGPLFLPVFGASLLAGIVLIPAVLLFIVPAIILALMFWPFYYLIVDQKAGIIESFSVARTITQNNWGTAVVLWMFSVGIMLLGCLAVCIGILFAAPLVTVMWATAYLMMSGQLAPYGQQPTPGQFTGQPTPGKW